MPSSLKSLIQKKKKEVIRPQIIATPDSWIHLICKQSEEPYLAIFNQRRSNRVDEQEKQADEKSILEDHLVVGGGRKTRARFSSVVTLQHLILDIQRRFHFSGGRRGSSYPWLWSGFSSSSYAFWKAEGPNECRFWSTGSAWSPKAPVGLGA